MNYNLTNYERETTINFNDDEKTATVYTCNKTLINHLTKISLSDDLITIKTKDSYSVTFIVPKKWVKIRPPRKVSEAQRQKAKERLSQYHKTKTE